jgi:DNA (cytosine-5)-methyltransferase 1
MVVSYDKLWKKLIDLKMNKTDFRKKVGISSSTLAKMGKNETISMDIILKICSSLNCDISDIMETIQK